MAAPNLGGTTTTTGRTGSVARGHGFSGVPGERAAGEIR